MLVSICAYIIFTANSWIDRGHAKHQAKGIRGGKRTSILPSLIILAILLIVGWCVVSAAHELLVGVGHMFPSHPKHH